MAEPTSLAAAIVAGVAAVVAAIDGLRRHGSAGRALAEVRAELAELYEIRESVARNTQAIEEIRKTLDDLEAHVDESEKDRAKAAERIAGMLGGIGATLEALKERIRR